MDGHFLLTPGLSLSHKALCAFTFYYNNDRGMSKLSFATMGEGSEGGGDQSVCCPIHTHTDPCGRLNWASAIAWLTVHYDSTLMPCDCCLKLTRSLCCTNDKYTCAPIHRCFAQQLRIT